VAVQLGPTDEDAYTTNMSAEFWNERYSAYDFVYGVAPNEFLASMADRLPASGRALDIGAGEGRNALFLATRGLSVLAVDQSKVGIQKALGATGFASAGVGLTVCYASGPILLRLALHLGELEFLAYFMDRKG
jgi:hypothetical protein